MPADVAPWAGLVVAIFGCSGVIALILRYTLPSIAERDAERALMFTNLNTFTDQLQEQLTASIGEERRLRDELEAKDREIRDCRGEIGRLRGEKLDLEQKLREAISARQRLEARLLELGFGEST